MFLVTFEELILDTPKKKKNDGLHPRIYHYL